MKMQNRKLWQLANESPVANNMSIAMCTLKPISSSWQTSVSSLLELVLSLNIYITKMQSVCLNLTFVVFSHLLDTLFVFVIYLFHDW